MLDGHAAPSSESRSSDVLTPRGEQFGVDEKLHSPADFFLREVNGTFPVTTEKAAAGMLQALEVPKGPLCRLAVAQFEPRNRQLRHPCRTRPRRARKGGDAAIGPLDALRLLEPLLASPSSPRSTSASIM